MTEPGFIEFERPENGGSSGRMESEADRKNCAEMCTNCRQICLATEQTCVQKGGRYADPELLLLLRTTALLCDASTQLLLANSYLHFKTCELCAIVTQACAGRCDEIQSEIDSDQGDLQLKRCAALCRQCAQFCSELSAPLAA
jgi:hypothetical protein